MSLSLFLCLCGFSFRVTVSIIFKDFTYYNFFWAHKDDFTRFYQFFFIHFMFSYCFLVFKVLCKTSGLHCGRRWCLINNATPSGIDPLATWTRLDDEGVFLYKMVVILARKLAKIFHDLITAGSFPTLWRTAIITPISKGSSPSQFPLDYWPISTISIKLIIYKV